MAKTFIINAVILLLLFLNSGCKKNSPTEPQPTKPPGYQEDIPWPSLADSPWPMYRADPQNTGRSKYTGALNGILYWDSENYVINSCVIGKDSTIYFAAAGANASLNALHPDGTLKWKYTFPAPIYDYNLASPVLASDETVYCNNPQEKTFFAVDNLGNLKWKIDGMITDNKINAISLEKFGNILFLGLKNGKTNLYYISKNGEILWQIENNNFTDGISFSPDGNTFYITSSHQSGVAFYAVDLSGTVKWQFNKKIKNLYSAPIVDSYGNIYTIASIDEDNYYLYSVDDEGNILWEIFLGPKYDSVDHPALDKFGNIYLGLDSLFSVKYDGTINWKIKIADEPNVISSPISINDNNDLFFTVGFGDTKELWKLNKDGVIIWKTSTPGNLYSTSSPVIGFNEIILNEISSNYFNIVR